MGASDQHGMDTGRLVRGAGFTLIELLVVIAIIVMLAALLLPSFKRARDNAKLTVCKHNMHDIGISMLAYAHTYPPWYPPVPYIGSILWQGVDNVSADDNLFVLWYSKFAQNPRIFTCPATTHKIRTPDRIEKVPTALGINFVIHTAGSAGHVNDFERLGQYSGTKGFGTSYEYNGYYSRTGFTTKLSDFWHVKMYKRDLWGDRGLYTTNVLSPAPWEKGLLSDADDSDDMAAAAGLGHITGANNNAINNWPEPWDNHGIIARNTLYADGHVVTAKYFR